MKNNQEYTLKDVKEIFHFLSVRSLQTWVKRGVIIPAQSAQGRGTAVKFDYLNLVEIGMVMQLVKFGFDRHSFLRHIMKASRKREISWMGTNKRIGSHQLGFDCFFVVSERDTLFAPWNQEWANRENFGVVNKRGVDIMLNSRHETGSIIVYIKAIERHVNDMIRNYILYFSKGRSII
jgi:hypothetical protein